jgi:hypothetical protein
MAGVPRRRALAVGVKPLNSRGHARRRLLDAWVTAWPFASEAAFQLAITELRPTRDTKTTRLWSTLESWLTPRAGGLSLGGLEAMRDRTWYDAQARPGEPTRLVDLLTRLAASYLSSDGDAWVLRADGDLPERAAAWRTLTSIVPPDVFVAAATARCPSPPVDGRVHLARPISELLQQGVSETHLHLGSAVDFATWWASSQCGLREHPPARWPFKDPLSLPLAALRDAPRTALHRVMSGWMMCGLAEAMLSRWLERGGSFGSLVHSVLSPAHRASAPGDTLVREAWVWFCEPLGNEPPDAEALWTAWTQLLFTYDIEAPSVDIATAARHVARLSALLQAIEHNADPLLEKVVWQAVRFRSLVYRLITLEPGTSGLDWFSRWYSRIGVARRTIDECLVPITIHIESQDCRLRSVEVRTTPATDDWLFTVIGRGAQAQLAIPEEDRAELGLILHFTKPGPFERADHDPEELARHLHWSERAYAQARAIDSVLNYCSEALLLLRGLDVANRELALPLWPIIGPLRLARGASRAAAARLALRRPEWRVRPFGQTFHIGEEYDHLLDGLRRMHELLEFRVLEHGDRVGHGLALGVDPAAWADRWGAIAQPVESRLDDLVWELDRYGTGPVQPRPGRIERLRREIAHLSGHLYDAHLAPADLVLARRLRHDPDLLRRFGYPNEPRSAEPTTIAERLVWRTLFNPDLARRARDMTEVVLDDSEVEAMQNLQAWVRGEYGRHAITVETCPSSNLLIADLGDLTSHPIFRLAPLPGQDTTGPAVLVSINSDNLLTSATNIADELAFVYYSLLRLGLPGRDARSWLDDIRNNAVASRFTLAASRKTEALQHLAKALG